MAQLVLSTLGQALGARLGGAAFGVFGAALGRAAGAAIGARIDQSLFGETRRIEGPRLTDIHIQGSSEGASIPAVFGRVRIAGQVIWAARFKEHAQTEEVETGGKGGGGTTRVTRYRYTLSFAVGLCEGEIARIGRVWANGEPFDLSSVAWRLHRGTEDQEPDPLIEAIEGADNAPAYRGLAYIVFEDLPLDDFGNAMPQMSFEIVRPAPAAGGARLEDMVRGVCLIPGAGEFVYATEPVRRVIGPGQELTENVHAERGRANFLVALDQLQADLPNCESVLLVVAWFGTDLRCGECEIRPGVEIADKVTAPISWRAGGVDRGGAHVVSQHEGAPAYGGTPADASVIAAIQELKARGFRVGLYPFVLMDVPADNGLPDPYGGAEQAAYPWRGRITLDPAPGEVGSPDKTGAASAQVDAFFGSAAPGHFSASGSTISYSGPSEWSYRRFILHNAKLAAAAGGVDLFLIGSELRGLTTARDSGTHFPAVDHLIDIAGDVRAMLGGATEITYAADWSEYRGHQPQDGTGDVFFHLDPLWADANVDCVGIDWYPPLTDWREGAAHLDASEARTDHDPDYLTSRIEGGEAFDWFYASEEDRAAQVRSDITDGAYGEPWVFRAKDVRAFWANAHHDRPGGVRNGTPTDWIPESKPVRFIELGAPAVDKGANAPNVFIDPKSAESALPLASTGARDDLIQRRVLEAYLSYWDGDANPVSDVYDDVMLAESFVWCWDARPHPAFPARGDVWADGASWRRGHWLSGRAGLATLADVTDALCRRAGVMDAETAQLSGIVAGYVIDAPGTARAALEPLMAAYGFDAREQDGALVFAHGHDAEAVTLSMDDLTADVVAEAFQTRADGADAPIEARVRFLDASRDYLVGAVSARRRDAAEGGVEMLDAPLVLDEAQAEALAERVLAERRALLEGASIGLGPAHLALEPGDQVTLAGETYKIARIDDGHARMLDLARVDANVIAPRDGGEPGVPPDPAHAPTPAFAVLDLPPLPGAEDDDRPLIAISAQPWTGAHALYAGDDATSATKRAQVLEPAIMGELLWALWPGPIDRWDEGNVIRIKLYSGVLASVTKEAALGGANLFAVEGDEGEWELVQARNCTLVGENEYELSGFLRGLGDSGHAQGAPTPVGRRIVKLDGRLARAAMGAHEWGGALSFYAPPAGAAATDAAAAAQTIALTHVALRPFSPVRVRAVRDGAGDVTVRWVRQARVGGLSWAAGEPPIGEPSERYLVEILDGAGDLVRSAEAGAESFSYSAADQTADFGAPPASLRVRIGQIGANGLPGLKTESLIPL